MSFEQFSAVMRRERRASREDLMQAFRRIDTNGDEYISAEELQRMLTKVRTNIWVFFFDTINGCRHPIANIGMLSVIPPSPPPPTLQSVPLP